MVDVVEICGDDVVWEFCEKLSGIDLYIFKMLKKKSCVNEFLEVMVVSFVENFGGDILGVFLFCCCL